MYILCSAVDSPVEILPCKSLFCCGCTLSLAATIPSFNCPGCSGLHESSESTFTKPLSIIEKMIKSLIVECDRCGVDTKVESLADECRLHIKSRSEVATRVLSQMMTQTHTIIVPTGGRVSK